MLFLSEGSDRYLQSEIILKYIYQKSSVVANWWLSKKVWLPLKTLKAPKTFWSNLICRSTTLQVLKHCNSWDWKNNRQVETVGGSSWELAGLCKTLECLLSGVPSNVPACHPRLILGKIHTDTQLFPSCRLPSPEDDLAIPLRQTKPD